MCKLKRR